MKRTAKIMVVLGLLVLCGSAWAVDGNEPIAHWKFDETSGTTAYDSVGDNDGTVYGAVWTAGQIDGALSFDGANDYVQVSDDDSLTDGNWNGLTISAWVYINSISWDDRAGIVLKHYGVGGDRAYMMELGKNNDDTDNSSVGITVSQTKTFFNGKQTYGTTQLQAGQWYHIATTWEADHQEVYVNGIEEIDDTDSAIANSIPNNNLPLYIGYQKGENTYFNGRIDDVRIYDRALSAEEVQQLYQEGLPELVGLEITGPEEVAEDFQTQYAAIAYYDNNSTRDVTDAAQWSVEPNAIASIDSNGLLTTEEIYILEEDITIHAQYTEDTNTVEAEKEVLVFAVCPSGSALEFDGANDYVDFGTGPAITGTGSFTASAWVNTDKVSNQAIMNQRSPSSPDGMYGFGIVNGRVQFQIYNSGYGFIFKSNVTVNDGLWHHIVAVRTNSTDGEIYVDGSLAGTGSGPAKSLNNVGVNIGRAFTGPFYFRGLIDDPRIYDRALSAEEIQMSMHMKLTGDEPNLVGYWDFDEGEGQVAYDLSSNGNNGYLGSDPCDVDDADPAWVDSDAPIGICTTGGLIERNISRALEDKRNAVEEIETALDREYATFNMLIELLRSREHGDWSRKDIIKARQDIHLAIQPQHHSLDTLEKSIEKLEDSLSILGYEIEPNGSNN